jgi:hypothetical protein
MVQKWVNEYNLSPSLYVIEKPATYGVTIAKHWWDIGTGTIHKQLHELGTID